MTASITKFPVAVPLRCSACGMLASGSCHCGVGYVAAGEYAAKLARERPELSSRELAAQTGVSQRTAARALQIAREPKGSPDAVVIGRDGKHYPAVKPHQRNSEPVRFYGHDDLGNAKSHIRQTVLSFKRGLSQEDWATLVAWVKEEEWETHH